MSLRITPATRPLTDRWMHVAIEPRGATRTGVSFRPLQAETMGLDPRAALSALLEHPYELVRLAALWNRMEPARGAFDPAPLDWQVQAAERAGKQLIIGLGAVKNFGYPEFFVPKHHLPAPLPEGSLVSPVSHPDLLAAAIEFSAKVVNRYHGHESVIAWQVEHEGVDPLGMEHSWRLSTEFVTSELGAVKQLDPERPILLNGFLPMSAPVAAQQWWRTRDQGDSLTVAEAAAEIIGLDVYPCHALGAAGGWGVYLDAGAHRWRDRGRRLLARAGAQGRRVIITEGQAEPWEAVTVPPNPAQRAMASCPPDRMIENYNRCLLLAHQAGCALDAYLFWGAEYWLLRKQGGDDSYMGAFDRIITAPGNVPRG
jgi:glycosyl hydrolase family 42 (putative beta-galactosidase)